MPAPVLDVLEEQLEYLLDHAGVTCAPNCAECRRLQTVKAALLRPFHVVSQPMRARE
jgi:hypothetical protein